MKILEQLWNNGLHPSETKLPSNSRYHKHLDTVTENEEKLLSMLSEEAKEAYKKYIDSREEMSATDNANIFITGFRMGARVMLEVMQEEK